VKVEGETVAAEPLDVPAERLLGKVIQVGKRRFARLV
jgi:tyrosyl-tRNA synthetase